MDDKRLLRNCGFIPSTLLQYFLGIVCTNFKYVGCTNFKYVG